MREVQPNDYVTILYDGFLPDGEVFESSKETGPLNFQMGTEAIFPGFEKELLGMKINEKKTFKLEPEEGFGHKKPELIHTVDRHAIGVKGEMKAGLILGLTVKKEGEDIKVPALITDVNGDQITVDFNHPLAGQTLKYEVTVTDISDSPSQDADACGCDSSDSSC